MSTQPKTKSNSKPSENQKTTLAPLSFGGALKGLLNTPPIKDKEIVERSKASAKKKSQQR